MECHRLRPCQIIGSIQKNRCDFVVGIWLFLHHNFLYYMVGCLYHGTAQILEKEKKKTVSSLHQISKARLITVTNNIRIKWSLITVLRNKHHNQNRQPSVLMDRQDNRKPLDLAELLKEIQSSNWKIWYNVESYKEKQEEGAARNLTWFGLCAYIHEGKESVFVDAFDFTGEVIM